MIGDDAHALPTEARQSHHQVFGEVLMHLEEIAVVHDAVDDFLDVVGFLGLHRHQGVENGIAAVGRILGFNPGRILVIVLRHERK